MTTSPPVLTSIDKIILTLYQTTQAQPGVSIDEIGK